MKLHVYKSTPTPKLIPPPCAMFPGRMLSHSPSLLKFHMFIKIQNTIDGANKRKII